MLTGNLLEIIQQISSEMTSHGDQAHTHKVNELNSKLTDGQLTIALCGHFSAGKSTLLNTLCGAKLLPSSPIPTSANVVSIRYGKEARAAVEVLSNGETRHDEVNIDQLDKYCIDGETFSSVSIQYPSELLSKGIIILDTPGIDSTDAAHKLATESALHLADVVFYVMDYNHVQSEINFSFAKELKDWGKPLYFIVNQIDKHRELELSFDDYRQSVLDAFHAWNLDPAGILYLSLREPTHKEHEWNKLNSLIDALTKQSGELAQYSVESSLKHLVKEHITGYDQSFSEERAKLVEASGGEEEIERINDKQKQLQSRITQAELAIDEYSIDIKKEIVSLLDNANITPAPLRDLAGSFLESRKPGFRQGLLFSKGKTSLEQERRAGLFRDELNQLIQAHIEWHLKLLLRNAGEKAGFSNETIELRFDEKLNILPSVEWLVEQVNHGAVFGNEYTLTYCKNAAQSIKANYRQQALLILEELSDSYKTMMDEELQKLRTELSELQDRSASANKLVQLDAQLEDYSTMLIAKCADMVMIPNLPNPNQLSYSSDEEAPTFINTKVEVNLDSLSMSQEPLLDQRAQFAMQNEQQSSQMISRLYKGASLIEGLGGLEGIVSELKLKAKRLEEKTFTIALFGAFSAGKSSLANALIGEFILPVSPNPTTASINSLLPPTAEYSHNTAAIHMKTEEALLDDLNYSLRLLGETIPAKYEHDVKYLFKTIDAITPDKISSNGRAHYSFIKAARLGWETEQQWLGKIRHVDRDQYVEYVAKEQLSCYVSEIKFYYDCPLTRAGIILVDTPGADSVNARHTGVAFNYIKNTDAILFITYYNHAFSHADRQFLDQLGRVKDQFELDKMFFIVNAADLANDTEELSHVLQHVESNLVAHRIMNPRLFPVSSLQALEGKSKGQEALLKQSGMLRFEAAFFQFIEHELARLALDSAEAELNRAKGMVESLLQSAIKDRSSKAEALQSLDNSGQSITARGLSFIDHAMPEGLKQEIEELMYYIVQRIGFKLGDFYNYAFNSSVLREDAKSLSNLVWTAWLELQRSIAMELEQELLATSLRIEKKLSGFINNVYKGYVEEVEQLLSGYHGKECNIGNIAMPKQSEQWEYSDLKAKWLWGQFKSPKQFFEGEGKLKLRQELEKLIIPSVQQWMQGSTEQWQIHYREQWKILLSLNHNRLHDDSSAYILSRRQLLEDDSYFSKIEGITGQMKSI